MTKPTKEDWAKFEKELSTPWGRVEAVIDGHKVTFQPAREKNLKYVIQVYVDGFIKGTDLEPQSPIAQKFYREVKKYIFRKPKDKDYVKLVGKLHGKAAQKELLDRHFISIYPWFSSAKQIQSKLLKTCAEITLFTEEQ